MIKQTTSPKFTAKFQSVSSASDVRGQLRDFDADIVEIVEEHNATDVEIRASLSTLIRFCDAKNYDSEFVFVEDVDGCERELADLVGDVGYENEIDVEEANDLVRSYWDTEATSDERREIIGRVEDMFRAPIDAMSYDYARFDFDHLPTFVQLTIAAVNAYEAS